MASQKKPRQRNRVREILADVRVAAVTIAAIAEAIRAITSAIGH